MATAIDSMGVRADDEENGENERAGERTTADVEDKGVWRNKRDTERERERERERENA